MSLTHVDQASELDQLRRSVRPKELTLKARENQIAKRAKSIQKCISKFNKEILNERTPENGEILTDLVLTVEADFEILKSLVPHAELNQDIVTQVINLKQTYAVVVQDEKDKQKEIAAKAPSHSSISSIDYATAQIQAAELDIEIRSKLQQAEEEQKIRDLEAQIATLKSQQETRSLSDRKQRLEVRQQLLQEYDVDKRSDIVKALDPVPTIASARNNKQHQVQLGAPVAAATTHVNNNPDSAIQSITDSEKSSDIQILADSLAKAMQISRYPVPEPPVYRGDPLEYCDWEISFRTLVENSGIPESNRIHYLKRYVDGPAKEAISGYFLMQSPNAYHQAKQVLKQRFGSEYTISQAFRSKLNHWPKLKNNDRFAMQRYADFLMQCRTAKTNIAELRVLDDSQQNMTMMAKLPDGIMNSWKRKVVEHRKRTGTYPGFSEFVEFVKDEADILNDPVLSEQSNITTAQQGRADQKHKALALSTVVKQSCLMCHKSNHRLTECYMLAKKRPSDRKQFILKHSLCFSCLEPNHQSSDCKNKVICKKCNKSHATAMHIDNYKPQNSRSLAPPSPNPQTEVGVKNGTPITNAVTNAPTPKYEAASSAATCGKNELNSSSGLSAMIVPIWLSSKHNPGKEILVYALLDTMSDTTFVTSDAINQLQATSKQTTLKLTTMTSDNINISCRMVNDLEIRGYASHQKIRVPRAYSRDSIPLDKSHIPTSDIAAQWEHLRPIAHKIPDIANCEVGMLIGYDTSKALIPIQAVAGPDDSDPYAVETALGWSIVGRTGSKSRSSSKMHVCNRVVTLQNEVHIANEPRSVSFMCEKTTEPSPSSILELLQQDFNDSSAKSQHSLSQDDTKFMNKLGEKIKQEPNGYYSMPLPFKTRPQLPDNRVLAEKRLALLKRKLQNDKQHCIDYFSFMNDIISAGDAEIAPLSESLSTERWYIPHFGVYHPKKRKIRVVFDCSAKYHDICLNDHLLQGPDLMNNLVGILHRFRRGKIAVMCDIQRMFHMFKVHEQDRDYLRFLWFSDESMTDVLEYRMTVHLFGAKSSPGCATFGLRKLATDHGSLENEHDAQALQFIMNDFYVDDGLMSIDSDSQMVGVINSAINICSKGNVRLHKFVCNDMSVLANIPRSECADTVKDLDLQSGENLVMERALGVQWDIVNDQFKFRVTLNNQPVTRRGILSTIASVYDPLGFLAPFILQGKQILQQLCRDKANWDDPVSDELMTCWLAWRQDLLMLDQIKIQRCLVPLDFGTIIETQLHHFSDASTTGYGQCSYLRLVNTEGKVHCTLLTGKSRVAPIKSVTVPRTELQAAVLSAKIAKTLASELQMKNVTNEVFWVDSKVVLGYIANEARKFHVYVANRVQQIRDLTEANQWHYVNTCENPADIASRGLSVTKLVESPWFVGPAFLWNSDELSNMLSCRTNHTIECNDPEVKSTCRSTSVAHPPATTKLSDRLIAFSSLSKAVRIISILQRRCSHKKKTTPSTPLTVSELERARLTILKWGQQDYLDDYQSLKENKPLPRNSPLYKLDPFVDENDLIRVGGRLRNSDLPFDEIHPIVLPKVSHVTKLIIDDCHKKVAHQGKGITMSEIRSSGYWIIGGSSAVASYIKNCVQCRRQRRPPETQLMSDLPTERTAVAPPFTYVGCDCFGPFVVKENRKDIKRYGIIFTCLASRAIHLELLDSMTTDAFINALRCFIFIRGPVRYLRTDRGTNFVGAANELGKATSAKLEKFAHEQSIDFVFNPPHASHMGGVWERQIRTVRSVLNSMLSLHKSRLDTAALRTFLYEVMAIVNCRPLTHHGDDKTTPLTPNQLLTMKSKVVLPPPGQFDEQDLYSRKRWRQVQGLANTFWSRWRKEYLHTLQTRQKWQNRQPDVVLDDIVIVKDESLCRNDWPLARVVETIKSCDGHVRKVKLLLANSQLDKNGKRIRPPSYIERPIHKIVVLFHQT